MKWVTYIEGGSGRGGAVQGSPVQGGAAQGGAERVGAVVDDWIVDLSPVLAGLPGGVAGGTIGLLAAGAPALKAAQSHVESARRAGWPGTRPRWRDVQLLAPVPRPGKVMGTGLNYADHAAELGAKPYEKPLFFAKVGTAVVGPGATVVRPQGIAKLDYEVELAVVIGRRAKGVRREEALAHVGGYTILDDVSAREFQFDVVPPQTTMAKSMDGFCPMGPWLVTADELPDPSHLTLRCWVNGELRQSGSTRNLIFDVPCLIEALARTMTLEPGDVIATGTPAGVGAFRKPPLWLRPGDRVRMEIPEIGVLEHGIG